MAERQTTTAPESVAVLDGVALQAALRAALVVAPTKGEHAVIAMRLPASSGPGSQVAVCAYDPARDMHISIAVPADHVDVADERDRTVELTPPAVRQLLAMKVKTPKEEDPWPSVSWAISETRVTQTDEGQLFGRQSRVLRENRDTPTLGDISSKLAEMADATPELTGVSQLTPAQTKALGNALGHLQEIARLRPLQPSEGQLASCLVLSESLAAHCSRPDKEKPAEQPDKEPTTAAPVSVSFADMDLDDMAAKLDPEGKTGLKIVRSNPPGGIA